MCHIVAPRIVLLFYKPLVLLTPYGLYVILGLQRRDSNVTLFHFTTF